MGSLSISNYLGSTNEAANRPQTVAVDLEIPEISTLLDHISPIRFITKPMKEMSQANNALQEY